MDNGGWDHGREAKEWFEREDKRLLRREETFMRALWDAKALGLYGNKRNAFIQRRMNKLRTQ